MGSAALFHLARRGQRVLGLERFDVLARARLVARVTRIIRLAYYEHSDVRAARCAAPTSCGASSRSEAGEQLLHDHRHRRRGGEQIIVEGVAAGRAPITTSQHEVLDRRRARAGASPATGSRRSSMVVLPAGRRLPRARALHRRARRAARWPRAPSCARASACSSWEAIGRAACACAPTAAPTRPTGSWSRAGRLDRRSVARLPPARVRGERQVLAWLQPTRPELFAPERLPGLQPRGRRRALLRLPDPRSPASSSAATSTAARAAIPTRSRASPRPTDEAPLRAFAESLLPRGRRPDHRRSRPASSTHTRTSTSSSTATRTRRRSSSPRASPGHGFKFCSVIGEIMADLALDGATRHDIELFRLDRFAMRAGGLEPPRTSRPNGT